MHLCSWVELPNLFFDEVLKSSQAPPCQCLLNATLRDKQQSFHIVSKQFGGGDLRWSSVLTELCSCRAVSLVLTNMMVWPTFWVRGKIMCSSTLILSAGDGQTCIGSQSQCEREILKTLRQAAMGVSPHNLTSLGCYAEIFLRWIMFGVSVHGRHLASQFRTTWIPP